MKKIYLLMVAMVWSLAARAYLPLVREGAKFYYYEWWGEYFNDGEDHARLNTFEFMGDTIISGMSYRKLFLTTTNMDQVWQLPYTDYDNDGEIAYRDFSRKWNQKDPILFVRENDKKVFALLNHPNENKEAVYWNDYNEMVIYDFDKAPSQWSEWELSDTIIDGQTCKMYKDKYFDSYLIEGIGYVDKKFYDLTNIYDFTTNEDSFVGMSHVENAAGEVIFKGPLYQKYDVKQPMLGDTNDDERIDVEDVNESINMVLRGDRIPFMRRVDLNGDSKVDVEDVNALVNIILKVE